jgi:hypothetical protein
LYALVPISQVFVFVLCVIVFTGSGYILDSSDVLALAEPKKARPGLQFCKAQASQSQAKAMAFRPGQSRT